MITQVCKINMVPGGMPPIIHASQYDVGSRDLTFELYNGSIPWKIPSGATVTIDGTKPDKKAFSVVATVSWSTVTVTLTQQMAAVAGKTECQLTVTSGENVLGSANFILDVERAAVAENADMSATDISSVETAKTQAIDAMQKAQAAQAAAETAKTAAEAATSGKADKTTPTAAQNVALLDAVGNLMDSGKQLTSASIGAILGISSGSWTPTLSGMSSYSYQRGRYVKIGDVAIVSFSIWGIMAGSNTEQIKVSGCPLIPADGGYSGGGSLSGYYTANDTIFTDWAASTDGSFYAYGQIPGSGNKWQSSDIFQKTEGECGGGGTIMFKTNS